MTLAEIAHGTPGRVHSVDPSADCAEKLMELGLVPGARVVVVRQAPLGDPLQVDVNGAHLALRRDAASTVLVELAEAEASPQ